MSYEDLMARIAREIPELAGKLSAPRIVYVKSLRKAYITFESSVLAGEREFLKLEGILRELFPGRPLAVRVISPELKDSFLEDPSPYRQVLDDFLRRNYPMARGWVGKITWQMEKNQLTDSAELPGDSNSEALLTLVFPDEISLRVMQRSDVGTRLALAIKEIFAARVRVEMTVEGTREERLRSEDMGRYFRVSADNRDLNYDKYFVKGQVQTEAEDSYTSHNTTLLDVDGVVKKILTTEYVQEELKGISHA